MDSTTIFRSRHGRPDPTVQQGSACPAVRAPFTRNCEPPRSCRAIAAAAQGSRDPHSALVAGTMRDRIANDTRLGPHRRRESFALDRTGPIVVRRCDAPLREQIERGGGTFSANSKRCRITWRIASDVFDGIDQDWQSPTRTTLLRKPFLQTSLHFGMAYDTTRFIIGQTSWIFLPDVDVVLNILERARPREASRESVQPALSRSPSLPF